MLDPSCRLLRTDIGPALHHVHLLKGRRQVVAGGTQRASLAKGVGVCDARHPAGSFLPAERSADIPSVG